MGELGVDARGLGRAPRVGGAAHGGIAENRIDPRKRTLASATPWSPSAESRAWTSTPKMLNPAAKVPPTWPSRSSRPSSWNQSPDSTEVDSAWIPNAGAK
jgi:hypothetical protein